MSFKIRLDKQRNKLFGWVGTTLFCFFAGLCLAVPIGFIYLLVRLVLAVIDWLYRH